MSSADDTEELREDLAPGGAILAATELPYDPSWHRELIRSGIGIVLAFTLLGFVAFACVAFWSLPTRFNDLKDLISGFFTPLLTLFGTITGFYFGEKSGSR